MNPFKDLEKYINKRIYPDQQRTFIEQNRLNPLFQSVNSKDLKMASMYQKIMVRVLLDTDKLLKSIGITPIHFKGMSLAYQYYALPAQRICTDIDFFVNSDQYDIALKTLIENGYKIAKPFDEHHISLFYNGINLEMHTAFFHPNDAISFVIRSSDLMEIDIENNSVTTLNNTCQLVYLFLHYYTHAKKGNKYSDKSIILKYYQYRPIIDLLRLYDIALLVDKQSKKIDWISCAERLLHVSHSIEFRFVLSEFIDIFPFILPNSFVKSLFEGNISGSDKYTLYPLFIKDSTRRYDDILADAVRHDDTVYTCPGFIHDKHRFGVDEFTDNCKSCLISGIPPKNSDDLSFTFDFWKQDNKLWFSLKVKDDVLNYITLGSYPKNINSIGFCDSFTICIASLSQGYNFFSIHSFLSLDSNSQPCLSIHDIVDAYCKPIQMNSIIKSSLFISSSGYEAMIGIPLSYLKLEKGKEFYFNVIVSDSDDENGCDTALAFDSNSTAWYDCRTYPIAEFIE